MDLSDTNSIYKLFENEKFDAVCNLAAQAGVRYSIENPHAYKVMLNAECLIFNERVAA